MRWGMVINLSKCVRCHACVAACRIEHFLPLTDYLAQVDRLGTGNAQWTGSYYRTGAL